MDKHLKRALMAGGYIMGGTIVVMLAAAIHPALCVGAIVAAIAAPVTYLLSKGASRYE